MRFRTRVLTQIVCSAAGVIVVAVSLSACGSAVPTATPSPAAVSTPTATPTPSASATPAPPTFDRSGTAAANLPYFDFINEKVIASTPSPVGMDFINALVAAGFDKADMQVTADKTTVGLTPGSIQFSVKFKGECLIGQNGAGSDGYHSEVAPVLSTGRCLIGNTVPIP